MAIQVALTALVLLAESQAGSQKPTPAPIPPSWTEVGDEATAVKASITVAKQAGTMSRKEVRDYGEDGINLVAQYVTSDDQIFGTIFIYRPSLADSGLTFLATDEAIRRRLGTSVKVLSDQMVPAGGTQNAGRRVVYADSESGLRSALMIIQAGAWLLKYRVSGPSSRANEIASNLDAMVGGTKFGKGSEPLPTHVIKVEPCDGMRNDGNAKTIKPKSESVVGLALLAVPRFNDEIGKAVADPTGRVPDRLCLAESSEDDKLPLLTFRTMDSRSGLFAPRIFQLFGDAGIIVEVTRAANGSGELFAIRHGLSPVLIYGGFLTEPGAGQMQLVRHRSNKLPIVAAISEQTAGNGQNIELNCNSFAEGCETQKK